MSTLITLISTLRRRLHISPGRLLLAIVVIPLAGIMLAGCASSASDAAKSGGAAGDQVGTSTGVCTSLEGAANGITTTNGLQAGDCDKLSKGSTAQKDVAALAQHVGQNRIAINLMWTLITGYLVMFMQAGFALVETGFTRAKSASHTMMMNFMVYGLGMLGYFIAGFAFQFGGIGRVGNVGSLGGTPGFTASGEANLPWQFGTGHPIGIFGTNGFFLAGTTYDVGIAVLFLFQMVFMDTAATIPTGAMAERWKFASFAVFGFFCSTLTYPIFGNWAWGGGWLWKLGVDHGLGNGYADFAGSGVVHSVGGWMGLAGAMVLGPRIGKYNKDGKPNTIPGHTLTIPLLGCFILPFG